MKESDLYPPIKKTNTISTKLIAPCGMNCRLCHAHVRDKNTCPGCRGTDVQKPKYCVTCRIVTCERIALGKARYCFGCPDLPCVRLRQLDKRYTEKYGMSIIDNLRAMETDGIRQFIRDQKEKWSCPDCGALICVHKPACLRCGHQWR